MTLSIVPLAEGKTQLILPHTVIQQAKDDITADDGKKHDLLSGKAVWSTTTSCNNFGFLRTHGIPVAFLEKISPTSFSALYCDMLPYEVVARREVQGKNFPLRRPDLKVGDRFDEPLIEFFLKTSNRRWKDNSLPCDDPLMRFDDEDGFIHLFVPNKPEVEPFLSLSYDEVFIHDNERELIEKMRVLTRDVFLLLEGAWGKLEFNLADFKIEFGIDAFGKLRVADVIDNDSGRLMYKGKHASKELYREDKGLDEVAAKFAFVAEQSTLLKSLR
ncbi:MAG: hypothetical protein JKX80_01615 [Candidatus Pacebacteria bacterium]|nr:hypothetical protein [Candidatus Paceibacterota bacterium]